MEIIYDPKKNQINIEKHGVSFEAVGGFEWKSAIIVKDDRKNYGEVRRHATGFIGKRLHVFVYTIRERSIRAISLRKANIRERKKYEKNE